MTMKKSNIRLAQMLTYSGTLPLVASVVLLFVPMAGIDNHLVARTYSAVILSFLCGIHWAVFLFFAEKCPHQLLITSNVLALLAWCSLLGFDQRMAFSVQALCFLILFALDLRLHHVGIVPEWFYHLRRNATIIVVVCLATLAVLS
jgi:Protein of unknown function (DUF3429)